MISFIYPNWLWALLLIAIPIIIHIVNLRMHKTIYFSNVNLLKRVQKETKRKSKLKQLLILACRIFIIIGLVMAFSKPYLPTGEDKKEQANQVVGIYIDNSFSMTAEGKEGKAIESAKQKAFAIVNGSKSNTRYALLTNDLSEQQNRFYSKNEIISLITEVNEEHNSIALSTIQLRFKNMMDNFLHQTEKSIYLISDFQKHSADLSNFDQDSSATYNFVPIPVNSISNIYIDTCWYDSPTHHFNQRELLNVRIVNQSETNYPQVPINFYLNDSLKAIASTTLSAGESKTIELNYTNLQQGLQLGRIEISDYPIVYDNNLFLAYQVKSELNTLVIHSRSKENKYWKALFGQDEFIKLSIERSDRLQISALNSYETIILDELNSISSGLASSLREYVLQGGSMVIIPGTSIDSANYAQFTKILSTSSYSLSDTIEIPINDVAYDHSLYADVFKTNSEKVELPTIKNRYRFNGVNNSNETSILTFADETAALTIAQQGSGKIYKFAFPISDDQNKFRDHLLFLPTLFNITLQSSNLQKLYYTLGQEHSFDLNFTDLGQTQNIRLKNIDTQEEIIPTILNQQGNNIKLKSDDKIDAGLYEAFAGENEISGFAFNYQLNESNLVYYNKKEIKNLVSETLKNSNIVEGTNQDLANTIEQLDRGKQLWRIFLFITLLFILVESAIIRFWK